MDPAWIVACDWPVGLEPAHVHLVQPRTTSTQPQSRAGECTVFFTGHLYNRDDLQRTLDGEPGTQGDVNNLLTAAYRRWGETLAGKLRGRYALVVWDPQRNLLLATRDPMGSMPLFYACVGVESIFFSTAIEPLLALPGVPTTLNKPALANLLCRQYPHLDETFYSAVRRVPLGHAAGWQAGAFRLVKYWEPSPPGTPDDTMRAEDLGEFDALLRQAVARCLRFGPTGIFLSGGLDSVSIAAVATDIARTAGVVPPHALSLAFPHPDCNEEPVQRGVASALDLRQTILPFDAAVGDRGLLAAALDLSAALPAPLQNPWRPAYRHLAEIGRAVGVRGILTGSGGDDWLTVNSDYMADLVRQGDVVGMARFLRAMLRSYTLRRPAMLRYLLWKAGVRPVLVQQARRGLGRVAPDALHSYRRRKLLAAQQTPAWIAEDPALRAALLDRARAHVERTLQTPEPAGPYGFYRHTGIAYTFTHPLITLEQEEDYVVGGSLGVELLHPYWDADLIQFLCRVPPRLLLAGGREKGVVRQTLARRFPDLQFGRQRKVSASDFFYSNLRCEAWEIVRRPDALAGLAALGIVDQATAGAFMAASLASPELGAVHRVWELLVAEAWVRPRL
jgi:asparagine synthase (glutamine-hydrolysing)